MAQTAMATQMKRISVKVEYPFWARLKRKLGPEHGSLNRRMRELILMEIGEAPQKPVAGPEIGEEKKEPSGLD